MATGDEMTTLCATAGSHCSISIIEKNREACRRPRIGEPHFVNRRNRRTSPGRSGGPVRDVGEFVQSSSGRALAFYAIIHNRGYPRRIERFGCRLGCSAEPSDDWRSIAFRSTGCGCRTAESAFRSAVNRRSATITAKMLGADAPFFIIMFL